MLFVSYLDVFIVLMVYFLLLLFLSAKQCNEMREFAHMRVRTLGLFLL